MLHIDQFAFFFLQNWDAFQIESNIGEPAQKQKAYALATDSDAYPKPVVESHQFQSNRNSVDLNLYVQQVINRLNHLESRSQLDFDRSSPDFSHSNCLICDSPDLFNKEIAHINTRPRTKGDRLQLVRTRAGIHKDT